MATSDSFRFAVIDDVDSLREMLLAERSDYESVVANGDLPSFIAARDKAVLVAAEARTVIAAIFITHDGQVPALNGLCVRPAHRRQGIGQRMIEQAIIEACRNKKPQEIVAFVDADDPSQKRRFEALGFSEVTDPEQRAQIGFDEHRQMMVLKLPQ